MNIFQKNKCKLINLLPEKYNYIEKFRIIKIILSDFTLNKKIIQKKINHIIYNKEKPSEIKHSKRMEIRRACSKDIS